MSVIVVTVSRHTIEIEHPAGDNLTVEVGVVSAPGLNRAQIDKIRDIIGDSLDENWREVMKLESG